MIRSFRSKDTEALFNGGSVPRFQNLRAVALRKLDMLDSAEKLADLRAPPANRLEALTGDRRGQHSIRINDQFRLCFVWTDAGPEAVEIVDYHR
ncbi:MAG TPA: type II toxin-antitoxin system RelE/ParE family toxin [Stellaceae bacterium]|jgi:proteic killer suppression protein|nr:type II toxin-antitoxin system RelE/ParE family toxin [Stellaceae bacterium]